MFNVPFCDGVSVVISTTNSQYIKFLSEFLANQFKNISCDRLCRIHLYKSIDELTEPQKFSGYGLITPSNGSEPNCAVVINGTKTTHYRFSSNLDFILTLTNSYLSQFEMDSELIDIPTMLEEYRKYRRLKNKGEALPITIRSKFIDLKQLMNS